MPISFDPPDFAERVARDEQWDERDWRHWSKLVTTFGEEFDVEVLQLVPGGTFPPVAVAAYPKTLVWETAQVAGRPILDAVAELSRKLYDQQREL